MSSGDPHKSATGLRAKSLRRGVVAGACACLLLAIPQFAAPYQILLLTYGLVMAIAALGFNLLLGYTGLLSFGHSAFFGAGAYTAALMAKYLGVVSMELFLVAGLALTALISAVFGVVCVRHTRIFFAILTMALSQVLWTLAYKFYWVTNGTDGLTVPFPSLVGGMFTFTGSGAYSRFILQYYYYVAVIFFVSTTIMWIITHSPIGNTLQSISDNEVRAEFIGIRVRLYRWIAFLLSGMFSGVAGVLWLPLNRHVTPDVLYWPFSGEIVFLTVLGGFQSFTGPIVGAIAFNYLKTYAVAWTDYWQLLLGIVLIVLVMVLPGGIVGTLDQLTKTSKLRWRPKRATVGNQEADKALR
jgi:branched-chain amino acid transport system permease protein